MSVRPIPEGYHSITPYLLINGAAEAIEFYRRAFARRNRLNWMRPEARLDMRKSKSAIPAS